MRSEEGEKVGKGKNIAKSIAHRAERKEKVKDRGWRQEIGRQEGWKLKSLEVEKVRRLERLKD